MTDNDVETQKKINDDEVGSLAFILDENYKVKTTFKNPQIKFLSCVKENKVLLKEISLPDMIKLCNENFDNWESSVVNASHLM